ncbi:MAG: DUF1800 family protein [Bryobacteraceae bacterium]|jgi:uncharacterized protein (DUF1800 family)
MVDRALTGLALVFGLAAWPAVSTPAKTKSASPPAPFSKQIPKEQRVSQALNRLTFGPRPGDAERVRAMGLKKWIDLQLHPARIAENPVLEAKLKPLDTLRMTAGELVRNYPPPQIIRLMANGQLPYPSNPDRRRAVQRQAERLVNGQVQAGQPPAPLAIPDFLTALQIRTLRTAAPQARLDAFLALPAEKQDDVLAAMPAVRQQLFDAAPPDLRRRIETSMAPQQVVVRDLYESKLLRAVYSNRQLEEVLVDFWFNHFNVYLDKGADRFLVTEYERDVIRPHVLGKFRDLLEATAKSPAMLFYLDNWQSVDPHGPLARAGIQARRGLNENYGRELMELHTLGVDGGYTQKDVTEVARCFTGWTIRQPQQGGDFVFNPRMHDDGEKVALGEKIPSGGGIHDGEKVLDILARHPATAHFISWKLAQRFVADDPPASLVDRMARRFLETGGDLREVLKTMIDSNEFWSVGAYRTKMKSPLEMAVSAVRAVDGDVDYAFNLANQVGLLGQPLYRKQDPNGYGNSSQEWVNSASLLARMNFALQLADNRLPGVKVGAAKAAQPGDPAGIDLGSPEFQKR